MRHELFIAMLTLLALPGCAENSFFQSGIADVIAKPDPGLLPPVPNTITPTADKLHSLPPPTAPVAVAVYGYGDQTGQMKPIASGANVQSLSRAVTQGATSVLMKALQDAGNGRWFTVIERERLDKFGRPLLGAADDGEDARAVLGRARHLAPLVRRGLAHRPLLS